jgi:hypothetical protein
MQCASRITFIRYAEHQNTGKTNNVKEEFEDTKGAIRIRKSKIPKGQSESYV